MADGLSLSVSTTERASVGRQRASPPRLAAVAAAVLCAEDFTGKVVAIIDGDTIKVMHNGVAERIRLWNRWQLAHVHYSGPAMAP